IQTAVSYSKGNNVVVQLLQHDIYKNQTTHGLNERFNKDLLQTPLSVKIDLSGSALSGKNIAISSGTIISLGSNQYILNIPYDNINDVDGLISVELSETSVPDYLNLNQPTGSYSIDGNTLNVSCDQPCKVVVFSRPVE